MGYSKTMGQNRFLRTIVVVLSIGSALIGLAPGNAFSGQHSTDLELIGSFETLKSLGFSPDDVVYWPPSNHLFISSAETHAGVHEVTVDGQLVRSYSFDGVPAPTGTLGFSVCRVTTGPRKGHFFLAEWNESRHVHVHEFDSDFNYIGYFPLLDPSSPPGDSIAYNPSTQTLIVGHGGTPDFLEVSLDGQVLRTFDGPDVDGLTYCTSTGTYFGVHHMSASLNEFTMSGTLIRTIDLAAFGVKNPIGVASGNDLLFVADEGPDGPTPGETIGVIYVFRLKPTVSVTATPAKALEQGRKQGKFKVARKPSTSRALIVNYAVSGSATNGVDDNQLSGKVTIPAGAASASIVVKPLDDKIKEGDETVTVTLKPSTRYTIGSPGTATVTITDNE